MCDIWNIHDTTDSKIMLLKSEDNNFIIVKEGNMPTIINGGNFILVHRHFFEFLSSKIDDKNLGRQVNIHDRQKNKMNEGYYELTVEHEVTPENISSLDCNGYKLWTSDRQYLFISNELKKEIENTDFKQLEMTLGFSNFGA